MPEHSKVSVIIPGKNRSEFVREAINSAINQLLPTFVAIEIIVIDAQSIPSYKSILGKEFPQVRFIRNNKKLHGPGSSRNIGLKLATGDYIAFLDNDDQWHPLFLKQSLQAIKENKSPLTVCLTWPFFDGAYPKAEILKSIFLNLVRTSVMLYLWLAKNRNIPANAFYLCQISHILFNRKLLKGVKFNETAVAAEDWEFFVDATKEKPIRLIFLPLVKFRYSWGSNTNSALVRAKKWSAYQDLIKKLPRNYKKGLLYKLFLIYIRSFGSR